MERYERPVLIASYSIDELRADAAACLPYPSDLALKREVETVAEPLKQLETIRRV